MMFSGRTWRLHCETCGAPLCTPFEVEDIDGKSFVLCAQPACGARTHVLWMEPGPTLTSFAAEVEFLQQQLRV